VEAVHDPDAAARPTTESAPSAPAVIDAVDVSRAFATKQALDGVSFRVRAGEIHALLGPNGAGKTTLLRILTGLLHADSGTVTTAGFDPVDNPRGLRERVGLVPSGDRTFYLRLSGLENLAFFARRYGMRRGEALARAKDLMAKVGLEDALKVRVGVYSHGMQKRLSVARALLSNPTVLLVDEATHDLDPEGAARVRELVAGLAANGVAVVWTTQRVEEIRGFADHVTLLNGGRVAFYGTVPALMAHSNPRRYIVQLSEADTQNRPGLDGLNHAVAGHGAITHLPYDDDDHFALVLEPDTILGQAIAALNAAGYHVVGCTEEQSEIEQAFMSLTGNGRPPEVGK
jgi:ABC-2 type transport system ATP-binding protein